MRRLLNLNIWLLVLVVILGTLPPAMAAELRVMISGGYAATLLAVAPRFEAETGNKIIVIRGPSMGQTPEAIPNRLARGEAADALIMVGTALDGVIRSGGARGDSRVDLALSGIGVAVRQGARHPDISTADALKQALLDARSIAYSDSASGVYLSATLFPRLGIADQIKDKSRMIPAEPVGAVVARGDADLGFQQISELKPIKGIDIVGPLPPGTQRLTVFAGAVAGHAQQPDAARALLQFLLRSPAARAAVVDSGMELANTEAAR